MNRLARNHTSVINFSASSSPISQKKYWPWCMHPDPKDWLPLTFQTVWFYISDKSILGLGLEEQIAYIVHAKWRQIVKKKMKERNKLVSFQQFHTDSSQSDETPEVAHTCKLQIPQNQSDIAKVTSLNNSKRHWQRIHFPMEACSGKLRKGI